MFLVYSYGYHTVSIDMTEFRTFSSVLFSCAQFEFVFCRKTFSSLDLFGVLLATFSAHGKLSPLLSATSCVSPKK